MSIINHKDLIKLMDEQEEINQNKIKNNFLELLNEEFVLNKSLLKNLNKIENLDDRNSIICELFKNNEIPTKKLKEFDISKQMKDQNMYMHKHTYIEIDYVYEGYCEYHIQNNHGVFRLEEKQLCIINQNVAHGINIPHENSIIIKCMIPLEYLDSADFDEFDVKHPLVYLIKHSMNDIMTGAGFIIYNIETPKYVEDLLYMMFSEFLERKIGWKQHIKNHISSFLITLMRIEPKQILRIDILGDKEKLNMPKILEYIRKNYKSIKLSQVAKVFHFHENYLGRKIKEHMKLNFQEYLQDIRIKEAEHLLITTDMTVKDISVEIGYKKPGFFYKSFKTYHNMTPIQYRENNKIDN